MLDFRSRSARRGKQGPQQRRRLLLLVLLLGLCLILIDKSRDPAMWRWFDRLAAPQPDVADDAGIDNRLEVVAEKQPPGAVVVPKVALAKAAAAESKKPDSPLAMFQMLGVDQSHFDGLADGTPIDAADRETLLRILLRLRRFPLVDLERWASDPAKLAEALREPSTTKALGGTSLSAAKGVDLHLTSPLTHGTVFRLRGRVTEIEPLKTNAEQSQRYETDVYYRCRLQVELLPRTVEVYTENVPDQWKQGAKPNAPAGVLGVYLKRADGSGDQATLVFAAPRLAWYPDNLLGRLGMDVGLLSAKSSGLDTPGQREAFYQMLSAVGRATSRQLHAEAEKDLKQSPANWQWTDRQGQQQYSVAPLFNEPDAARGRLVELVGTARRIEEIRISDADVVQRFGIDHYYQVSLFTDDSQGNPLTFCLRELPEGMPYGNLPRYGESVRIAGFFFTTWSYPVTQAEKGTRRQLSPLLIGRTLTWYPMPKPAATHVTSIVIGGLLLAATIIIWLLAWQTRLRQRKRLAQTAPPQTLDWPQGPET